MGLRDLRLGEGKACCEASAKHPEMDVPKP